MDIGVPGGFCIGWAAAMNASGEVVGEVTGQPARWLPNGAGGWTGQILPFAGSSGSVLDVNDAGVVAGQVNTPAGLTAVLWSAAGSAITLPNFPGSWGCAASGINASGQVTGHCADVDSTGSVTFGHAVLWTDPGQTPTELTGLPGAQRNSGVRINSQGTVVGYNLFPDGTRKAVRWVPNGTTWTVEDLGTLGGESQATDINDAGQIVGWSRISAQTKHAFLWDPASGMRDLGVWHTGDEAVATGINDPVPGTPVEIVGSSGSLAIIWRPL